MRVSLRLRWLVLLAAVPLVGCAGKLFEVHEESKLLSGIPFYRLAASCTQETVLIETLYQVSIQVPKTATTSAIVLMEKTTPTSGYLSSTMQDLRTEVTAPTPDVAKVLAKFAALPLYNPNAEADLVQQSNTVKADTFVDYSKTHFLNVSRPAMGSVSATTKLNPNGTLSEGTAEVEDTTAETLIGAFPIGEVTLGILTKAGALGVMMEGEDAATPRPIQLVVTPTRFKHSLSKTERANPPCVGAKALTRKTEGVNVRREAIPDGGGQGDKDDAAIGVTGKITLPKKEGGN
jgi:hypothetical protein